MYNAWVFIHLAGVFGFLLAHGVSVSVLFRLQKERNPERVNDLIALSGSSIRMFYVSLGVLVAGGIVAGFVGHWWSQGWIWAAVGVLLLSTLLFGFASNLQNVLGILNSPVPSDFLLMLPYLVTIFAVAGFVGQVRGPAAAGKPYIKG